MNVNFTVINSCAVTENAEKKVRYEIRKAKKRFPNKKIVLSGYSNGLTGYLPTAVAYEEGGYETRNTPLSPESEELILHICDSEIKNLTE